jgi:CTP synthase
MDFAGTSPDGNLVEVIELPGHPWYVAGQCHPEFKWKSTRADPLFRGFVQASLRHREQKN